MVTGAYYLIVTYDDVVPADPRRARRVALHADLGPHSGDSADPHPAVPARVAGVAAKKQAGTLKRPSFAELFAPEFRTHHHRHDGDDGVRLRRGLRRHPADAAHRAGPARKCARSTRTAQEQTISGVQSFQEFGGLAGRMLLAGLAAVIVGRRRLLSSVPDSGLVHPAGRVSSWRRRSGLTLAQWGIFARRPGHDRADQLLGQLSAARLPDAPARHRRELRGQRRRPDDRHLRGAGHDVARHVDARRIGADPARLCGGIVGTTAYVIAVIASSGCRSPKGEALPGVER